MKKVLKRLELNREAICHLTNANLKQILGGAVTTVTERHSACLTDCRASACVCDR